MRNFDEIYAITATRKGGKDALEALLKNAQSVPPPSPRTDDRWLACMTKCIFQAGFNWKVVESMWPGFEAAFHGFDLDHCAFLHDEDFDRLVSDKRIVRHGTKIRSVQQNAVFLDEFSADHDTVEAAFTAWPSHDFTGLLTTLKKRGSRLGGNTGQYFLRFMGVDGFILSRDVVARLVAEGVIDKTPTSQKALAAVQNAFNTWQTQSGRSYTHISRILAMSIG